MTLIQFRYPEDVGLYKPDNENDQLAQFFNEVRKVFQEELVVQMNLAKKASRNKNIEFDAISAAGSRRSSITSLSDR